MVGSFAKTLYHVVSSELGSAGSDCGAVGVADTMDQLPSVVPSVGSSDGADPSSGKHASD